MTGPMAYNDREQNMVTKELYEEAIFHLTNRVENVNWLYALTGEDKRFLKSVRKDLEQMVKYCDQILQAREN